MDIIDLLQNDVKIVDHSLRERNADRGRDYLVFPGEFMPDGKPLRGEVPEKLDPTILSEWCNTVRREWSARQNSKEAASKGKHSPVEPANGPPGGTGPGPSGGSGSDQARREACQASLEELIETKVAFLRDLVRANGQVRDAAAEELGRAAARHDASIEELRKAEDALAYIRGVPRQ